MSTQISHHELEDVLRRAGSNWSAAQAHGLLCSRLAVMGAEGGPDWLGQILQDSDPGTVEHGESIALMDDIYSITYEQLAARQSEFGLLLPVDSAAPDIVTSALAEWCEGFLHGLVSDVRADDLKQKLATDPLDDIIKDMLQITRAEVDADEGDDENEEALTELVEYLRVAAQLVYEELAKLRHPVETIPPPAAIH